MRKELLIFRAVLILLAVSIIGFLFYLNLVPSGRYFVWSDFKAANPAVSVLYPESRVKPAVDGWTVNEEPVYFDVRLPRKFDAARVKIYFDNLKTDVLELGIEGTPGAKNFTFAPLKNKFLDTLAWPRLSAGALILYQRDNLYGRLDDFFRHLPPPNQIAAYRAPFSYNYKIPGYAAGKWPREIQTDFIGSFKFYTYLKDEPLDFKFTFKSPEAWPAISVRVFSGDKLVVSRDYVDIPAGAELAHERTFHLYQKNLPEGVYRVAIAAPSEIIVSKIITPAWYLSFIGPLRFSPDSGPKNILTSARRLYAKNWDELSAMLVADGRGYRLNIPEQRYDIEMATLAYVLKPLWFDRGIELDGDGLFAFDWLSFFDPVIQNFNPAAARAGIVNYLLTGYQGTSRVPGSEVGAAVFDLTNISPSGNRKIRFVLSLPGFQAGEDSVKIKKVEVEFTGAPISWGWIKNKFLEIFKRLL